MRRQSRDELNRKARERMAAYRQTPEYQDWLQRSRELRRQLKAKYRRDAGATPLDAIKEAADAKRAMAAEQRRVREALAALHDAHVRRYRDVLSWRESGRRQWLQNPEPRRTRQAARRAELVDWYVRQVLCETGFPVDAIDAHVMELKREAILLRRLSRQIKNEISNQAKELS